MKEAETHEKSNPQPCPGAALSKARQARQLSLADTAQALKLPVTTIELIEADQFDQIASIYRRGYIVNYARLVEVDPEPLLEQMGELEPAPLRTVLPAAANPQRFDRFLKFATYALVTTMIVPPLVYFFVLGGARLFESEVVSRSTDGGDVSVPEVQKPGYRERLVDALAVQPSNTTQDDGSHLSASALPMNPARSAPRANVENESIEAAAPDPAQSEIDPMSRLELALSDDSWVEIEGADGQRLEFDLLRSGETRRYSGRAPFRLLLGRASAVEVRLDGETVVFDGQTQAGVAELVIGEPASGAADAANGGALAE